MTKKKEKIKIIPRLLNLGCGNRKLPKEEGWINIDKDKTCEPDIIRDLDKGLPFDSNTIDGLYASHVIEHVEDVFFFMYEIWRVCKPNVLIEIIAPDHSFPSSIWPNHKRDIRPNYFTMWLPNMINPSMNYKTETMGAEFISINESMIETGSGIRFILKVVKDENINNR